MSVVISGPSTTSSNPGAGFAMTVSAPTTLVQLQHNLPFTPAGVLVIDTQGNTVEYASVTNPSSGLTEVSFGFPFTGNIYLS